MEGLQSLANHVGGQCFKPQILSDPDGVAAEGASTAIVTVKRTGSREGSATVHFETSDGTAQEG